MEDRAVLRSICLVQVQCQNEAEMNFLETGQMQSLILENVQVC